MTRLHVASCMLHHETSCFAGQEYWPYPRLDSQWPIFLAHKNIVFLQNLCCVICYKLCSVNTHKHKPTLVTICQQKTGVIEVRLIRCMQHHAALTALWSRRASIGFWRHAIGTAYVVAYEVLQIEDLAALELFLQCEGCCCSMTEQGSHRPHNPFLFLTIIILTISFRVWRSFVLSEPWLECVKSFFKGGVGLTQSLIQEGCLQIQLSQAWLPNCHIFTYMIVSWLGHLLANFLFEAE